MSELVSVANQVSRKLSFELSQLTAGQRSIVEFQFDFAIYVELETCTGVQFLNLRLLQYQLLQVECNVVSCSPHPTLEFRNFTSFPLKAKR